MTHLAWAIRREDVARSEALAREAIEGWTDEDPPETRGRALLVLGYVAGSCADFASALNTAKEGLVAVGPHGDPSLRCRLHTYLARSAVASGALDVARLHADAASDLAGALRDDEIRVCAGVVDGVVALSCDEADDATAHFQRALERSAERFPVLDSEALCCLGMLAEREGRSEAALELQSRSLGSASAASDQNAIARARTNLAIVYRRLGHPVEARTHIFAALSIVRSRNDRRGLAMVILNIGGVERDLDATDLAVARFEEALAIFQTIGDTTGEVSTRQSLGTVRLERGEYDDADRQFSRIIALADETVAPRFVAHAVLGRARVLAATGKSERAIAEFETGERLILRHGARTSQAQALIWRARAHLDAGDSSSAQEALCRALPIARELDRKTSLADVHRLLAECHEQTGEFEAAYRESREAQSVSAEIAVWQRTARQGQLQTMSQLEHARTLAAAERERTAALADANASLARVNQDLREYVDVVASDLRRPLADVLAGADRVSCAPAESTPDVATEMLAPIVRGAEEIEQIISRLLAAGAVSATPDE